MFKHTLICLFALFISIQAPDAFAKLEKVSKTPFIGAIVIDADTGQVLKESGAKSPGYPASMIKMMDALLVLEQVKSGRISLEDRVLVTAEAARMGGSQVYLKEGETFTVDELLYALMIQSANDAAVALAIHIAGSRNAFEELMREKARELGMNNTQIESVHGLPPGKGQKPDVSTAYDMALLGQALSRMPEIYRYTATTEKGFRDNTFIMRTHNNLLGTYQGCDGFKTGYFRAGGFSITATALRNGRRVIAVILGSESKKVRDQNAKEWLSAGFLKIPPIVPTPTPVPVLETIKEEDLPVMEMVSLEEPEQKSRGLWWKIPLGLLIALGLIGFWRSRR